MCQPLPLGELGTGGPRHYPLQRVRLWFTGGCWIKWRGFWGEIPGSVVDLQSSRGSDVLEGARNITKALGPVGGAAMSSKLTPEEQFLSSIHFLHTYTLKVAGAEHPGIPQAAKNQRAMQASRGCSVSPRITLHGLPPHHSVRYHVYLAPAPSQWLGLFQALHSPAAVLATVLSAPHVGQLEPRFLHPNVTVLLKEKPQLWVCQAMCTARPNPCRPTCFSHLQSSSVMSRCPPPSTVWPSMCLPSSLLWLSLPCTCTQEGLLAFALHYGLSGSCSRVTLVGMPEAWIPPASLSFHVESFCPSHGTT
ncbi:hypothetical protein P7K49_005818 [Saguinus oedipus]|uniref:Uncharacterized protein n=1 Tax=Saguinus oedipus TaxID=9490 RepID=A0ABQ9W471_SAGOE|nr:hypothetical protein P7K49_005818 [Saguinus oedipus]